MAAFLRTPEEDQQNHLEIIADNNRIMMKAAIRNSINQLTQIYNDDFLFMQSYTQYKNQHGYISHQDYQDMLVNRIFKLQERLQQLGGGIKRRKTIKKKTIQKKTIKIK
jgi:hypothetical protein